MIVHLNQWIDRGETVGDTTPGAAFERLHAYLGTSFVDTPFGGAAPVTWTAQGVLSNNALAQYDKTLEATERYLQITAHTTVRATCTRCLGMMDIALSADTRLRVFQSEVAADEFAMREDADDLPDPIVASAQFDLILQVEEELLLDLPDNPTHPEGTADCVLPIGLKQVKPSPFDVLSALKKV